MEKDVNDDNLDEILNGCGMIIESEIPD